MKNKTPGTENRKHPKVILKTTLELTTQEPENARTSPVVVQELDAVEEEIAAEKLAAEEKRIRAAARACQLEQDQAIARVRHYQD